MPIHNDTPLEATESEWQRECARRVMLRHLGLTPLISRFDPAGAKLANRLIAPEDATENVGLVSPSTPTGDKYGAEHVRALLRDIGSTPSSNDAPVGNGGDSNAAETAVLAQQTERISLLVVVTADVIWVELLEDFLLRKEQLRLIAGMARAVRGEKVSSAHQRFDWPPAGSLSLSTRSGGLQDMLSGFLGRLIADNDAQFLIRLGSVEALPSLSLSVRDLPSSIAMLRDPAIKREAWSELRSLPGRV